MSDKRTPFRRTFFPPPETVEPLTNSEFVRATPAPYGHERPMTSGAEVINISQANKRLANHHVEAWQTSAWEFIDQIGELKSAFNLTAQVVGRAFLYPAVVVNHADVPIATDVYEKDLESHGGETNPQATRRALREAEDIIQELVESGRSEILRLMALNLSVAGECYLLDNKPWTVASVSEFTPGTVSYYNRRKDASARVAVPPGTYVARIWRAHPRWTLEADSSMLGILDQCEKLVLFDQAMRASARSRLNAGIVVVPTGLVPLSGELSADEAIAKATIEPVETEESAASVTPLILQGPPDQLDKIQRIDLGRKIDSDFLTAYDSALDRMLSGVDLPKEIISGLADVKYANALVIDDSLYKAHIEPLLLLICDALTTAYLRPRLLKAGVPETLVNRMAVWYNPSQIVTRPDRSQAATEGYDKYLLSGKAWRGARGFSESDAPNPDELVARLALKTPVPLEMAPTLIESLNPDFFRESRAKNQDAAGVPDDVRQLLSGSQEDTSTPAPPNSDQGVQQSGGDIMPDGVLPETSLADQGTF